MMTLDEAIEHCKEKRCGNDECALEHKQLAEWLTELKSLKDNDRVQKIRDEIERRIALYKDDAHISAHTCGYLDANETLLSFIDSMKEEPVSVWHDASKIPDNPEDMVVEYSEYGITIIPACRMSRVKGAKWARLDDILKL